MSVRTRVPACILDLEKFWFLSGFLPLNTIVPPKPTQIAGGEQAVDEAAADSDTEAQKLLFGSEASGGEAESGPRRTWRDLATRAFQPDTALHTHLEELIHEMESHEDDFVDPLHRPWKPREFLKTIETYIKLRCRADMNHCQHCGQMNPSEYKLCLRCRTKLEEDTLEHVLEEGTVEGAMAMEGFRILPSPCIKFFLLCEQQCGGDPWEQDMREVLRPLYFLFTRSRFLAGDMVADTTEHHIQAASDLNNLNRHLNASLAKGKQIVEEMQTLVNTNGCEAIRSHWSKVADAALEAQQNLCLMIDAWEEFEGVRLDQWWDDASPQLVPVGVSSDPFGMAPMPIQDSKH